MKIKKTVFTLVVVAFSVYKMSSQNSYSINMDLKTENSRDINFKKAGFGGEYAYFFKSKYKITNTLQYTTINVRYLNDSFGINNIIKYNEIENTLDLSYNTSKKIGFNLEIKPVANYEQNLNTNDVVLYGGFKVDYVIDLKNKISFGVNKTNVFGKPEILPTFSFGHEINKKLAINVGFPESKISFYKNNLTTILVRNSFNGNYYNLDNPVLITSTYATKASFSQMTTTLEYERNIDTNWFLNFKAGYDFYRNYSLLNDQNENIFNYNINNGYDFSITIKFKH